MENKENIALLIVGGIPPNWLSFDAQEQEAIASGSDGNVWLIEVHVPAIARISTHYAPAC